MKVFAISDLHLSGDGDKPMDIFGSQWDHHWDRICEDWKEKVSDEDLVLIAGDISWAMTLQQAVPDLRSIEDLPGKKVLLRGNHDYWWNSLSKVMAALGSTCNVLQNNAFRFGKYLIAGSRGWMIPGEQTTAQDQKIFLRELQRMTLSLEAAERMRESGDRLIIMTHYPPFNEKFEPSEMTALFEEHRANTVLYGHLHGRSASLAPDGVLGTIRYQLTSCDHLDFKLFGPV